MPKATCANPSCEQNSRSRGYCGRCYMRRRRAGELDLLPDLTLEERFWRNVTKGPGCWTWTASHYQSGYCVFNRGYAHRYAYEFAVGPIPAGHQVDHICHNRGCVNPAHLRPATNKQNNENLAGLQANNSSGFTGAYLHKHSGLYMASVCHDGERIFLGYFRTAEEAGEVARAKRLELFTHNNLDRSA